MKKEINLQQLVFPAVAIKIFHHVPMDSLKHIAASFFSSAQQIISKVFLQKLEIKYPSSGGGLPPGVPCSLKLAVVGRERNERLDLF